MRPSVAVKRTLLFVSIIGLGLLVFQTRFLALEANNAAPPYAPTGPPVIFSASETVRPGEVLNIVAGNLPNDQSKVQLSLTYINRSGTAARRQTLDQQNYSQNLIQAKAPTDFPFGIWRVELTTPLGTTTALLNQPRVMAVDASEVVAGQAVRIWGRNLSFAEWLPQISPSAWFIAGQQRLAGAVTASDRYSMAVTPPASLNPGSNYAVVVQNGYGGGFGEATSDVRLTSLTKTTDPLSLGVPWAHKLTFIGNSYNVQTDPRLATKARADGVSDDTAAIQAAIDLAHSSGGGTVYLPTGHYLLDGGVVMRSRTIIRGDGPDQTRIDFNRTYDYWRGFATFADNTTLSGISGLTANNLNQSQQTNSILSANDAATNSDIFLHDLAINYGSGRAISLSNIERLAIINSVFRDTSLSIWPIVTSRSRWITFRGNTVEYRCCRTHFTYNQNGIIEGNTFILDSAYAQSGEEKGALELSYSENLIVTGNTVKTVGDQFLGRVNEQEMMLTQGGGDHDDHAFGFGSVTAATSTTLSDSSVSFHNFGPFSEKNIVAITSGNGAGQWRFVVGRTGNTLTVDRPWDIVPSVGASYNVQTWTAYRLQITRNTFKDTKMAVHFYSGGWDNLVAQNTAIDGGYFSFGGRDVKPDSMSGDREYREVLWKTLVTDNKVSNPKKRRRSFIDFFAHQFDTNNKERTVFNNEARDNEVTAAKPNENDPLFDYDPIHNMHVREGFNAFLDWRHQAKIKNIPTVSGIIFQNNAAYGFGDAQPFFTGDSAVTQTFISFAALPSFGLPDQSIENESNELRESESSQSKKRSQSNTTQKTVGGTDTHDELADEVNIAELTADRETRTSLPRREVLIMAGLITSIVTALGYVRWRYQLYRHRH